MGHHVPLMYGDAHFVLKMKCPADAVLEAAVPDYEALNC